MVRKLFSILSVVSLIAVHAQQDFVAITGQDTKQILLNDFRFVDTQTGISGAAILKTQDQPNVFSAITNEKITENITSNDHALAKQIAALGFLGTDQVIYMPLYSSNIFVMDLASKNITRTSSPVLKTYRNNLGSHFTRMATLIDGSVYALTNSGSQLVKIKKTSGKILVEDFGAITDSPTNGETLLSKMNTGFGGDMIADQDGNLYVFSAYGNVFKISLNERSAAFIGHVKALPEGFTINASAVNRQGEIVIGSSKAGGIFKVNFENFMAEKIGTDNQTSFYDFGSPYVYDATKALSSIQRTDIFPTNITTGITNFVTDLQISGGATIQVFDASGKLATTTTLNKIEKNKTYTIDLNALKTGFYVVQVTDGLGKVLLTKKLLVNN